MMTLDSQPFSIVEDAGFLQLLAQVCNAFEETLFREDNA